MNELVQRLLEGDHPIVASRYKSAMELKQAIDQGYILVKFTDTKGETELGVKFDHNAVNLDNINFSQPSGIVHISGTLTLNYVKVQCFAAIDIVSLKGEGHLEIVLTS